MSLLLSRLRSKNRFLFDLDGTLVDSNQSHQWAFCSALITEGLDTLSAEFRYQDHLGKKTDQVFEEINIQNAATRRRLTSLKREYYLKALSEGKVEVCPGALQLLERLTNAGKLSYLVTGASARSTERVIELLGLAPFLSGWITGDDVIRGKPDPEAFRLALRRFNLKPHTTLTVEDSPLGVQASISAGVDAVLVHAPIPSVDLHTYPSLVALGIDLFGGEGDSK